MNGELAFSRTKMPGVYVKLPWIDHNALRIQDGGAIVEKDNYNSENKFN